MDRRMPFSVGCFSMYVRSDLDFTFTSALTSTGIISVPFCIRKSISTRESFELK